MAVQKHTTGILFIRKRLVFVADIKKLKKVGALLCKSSKIMLHLNCFRSSDDLLCKIDSKLHISLISFLIVDPICFII